MAVYNKSIATTTSTSPLTSGTLFTYKGDIKIVDLIGKVTTIIQDQTTTCKLSIVADSLAGVDLCTATSIRHFAVGSLLYTTGTAGSALQCTTAVGVAAPSQASAIYATSITSGIITVTYSAASTGAITWEMFWYPLSQSASVS